MATVNNELSAYITVLRVHDYGEQSLPYLSRPFTTMFTGSFIIIARSASRASETACFSEAEAPLISGVSMPWSRTLKRYGEPCRA